MAGPNTLPDSANPFREKVISEYFVGREPELAIFRENLKALKSGQPNHSYIAGLDGTGKTWYLNKLVELAIAQNYIGVYLALDSAVGPHRQLKTVLREIINELERSSASGTPPGKQLSLDWDSGASARLFRLPRTDVLITAELRQDFELLASHVKALGRDGVVLCLDEGQRIEPLALSALKNALNMLGSFLVVLSLRLISDTRGAVQEGRQMLNERAAKEGDIGASGFYVTGTAMGPFETNEEVRRFFAARLVNKTIQFADEVLVRIGDIAERVPRKMNNLAAQVYGRAMAGHVTKVEPRLLDDCFQEQFQDEMKLAVDLSTNLSGDLADLIKGLCAFTEPTTALDLVRHAFPDYREAVQALIEAGAARQLDSLSMATPVIQKLDEKYKITNSVYRYALKVAFKIT